MKQRLILIILLSFFIVGTPQDIDDMENRRLEEVFKVPKSAKEWPKGVVDFIKNFHRASYNPNVVYKHYVKGILGKHKYMIDCESYYKFKCAKYCLYQISSADEKVDSLEIADIVLEHTLVDFEIKKDRIIVYRTVKFPQDISDIRLYDEVERITDGKTPVECIATTYSLKSPFKIISRQRVMRVMPIARDFDADYLISGYEEEEDIITETVEHDWKKFYIENHCKGDSACIENVFVADTILNRLYEITKGDIMIDSDMEFLYSYFVGSASAIKWVFDESVNYMISKIFMKSGGVWHGLEYRLNKMAAEQRQALANEISTSLAYGYFEDTDLYHQGSMERKNEILTELFLKYPFITKYACEEVVEGIFDRYCNHD